MERKAVSIFAVLVLGFVETSEKDDDVCLTCCSDSFVSQLAGSALVAEILSCGHSVVIAIRIPYITAGIDYSNTVRMMEENRQYSIDMYGYNLQNIQAIPTSLTKTSALTYNTRVWPFIEYYTCTESERKALKDKIKYNGMTVMKIGQLSDYPLGEDRFYKGQVIRLNTNMDSHMAYEIYNELKKGVYL